MSPSRQSPIGKDARLHEIGTVGRLSGFQETPDGRYIITLTGVCRFRLSRELPSNEPFRICEVDYNAFAEDLADDETSDTIDREYLLTVLRSYLKANDLSADWSAVDDATNEFLVNTLAMICPYGAAEKQALLEANTIAERADVLIALAEMELASSGGSDGSGSAIQ